MGLVTLLVFMLSRWGWCINRKPQKQKNTDMMGDQKQNLVVYGRAGRIENAGFVISVMGYLHHSLFIMEKYSTWGFLNQL